MLRYLKKILQKLAPQLPAAKKGIEQHVPTLQKGVGKIIIRQKPAFIDAAGILLNNLYLYQRGTPQELTPLARSGDSIQEHPLQLELTAPADRPGEIEVVLLQSNELHSPLKDWIGVYCIYTAQARPKKPIHAKISLQIEAIEGTPALTLLAHDTIHPKPLTITWAYPGEYCWEVQDTAFDFLKQVYGFVTFLKSGAIIGYQEEGHWLLPGGLVSAPSKQEQKLVANQATFQQMRRHLEAQTGLVLTQLSDPYAITITELTGGLRHINMFHVAGAIGALTKGLFLDPKNLPDFSAYVDSRTIQTNQEQFLTAEGLEDISQLPANIDPVSRRPAGGMEGLYITAVPTMHNPAGAPCYQMLRFYPDGLVLQAGVCDADIDQAGNTLSAWFHRETEVEIGRGIYYTLDQQVWFTTSMYFTPSANEITLDFAGIVQDADHLDISVRDRRTEVVTADVKYRRYTL